MASIALHRKSIPHKTLLKSTTFSHFFSSSSSNNDNPNPNPNPNPNNFSSYFSDIKSKLKQQQQQPPQQPPSRGGAGGGGGGGDGSVEPYPFSNSLSDITAKLKQHQQQQQQQSPRFRPAVLGSLGANSGSDSKDELMRNLAEFRRRAASDGGGVPLGGGGGERRNQSVSFDVIRESLSKIRMSQSENNVQNKSNMSFNNVRAQQPPMPDRGGGSGGSGGGNVFGGSALPMRVFGKEMNEKKGEGDGGGGDDVDIWMRTYDLDELGKKLRELRPEVKGKKGEFSVAELNERLKKVKENDRKEESAFSGKTMTELRRSISAIKLDAKNNNNEKMVHIQGLDILGPGTPKFMLSPPKEHLVEKYFHPDNMSAAEKLKIELKKVRDEFKMHESDCGSTRVQIAQLTTEILHLSSVLLKKDKHSRRGLQAKVQQRKKLLKYLRRTDWESYCFVLSKLGLRDNPDYKN